MRTKRICCVVLVFAFVFGCFSLTASAALRATGQFNFTVPAREVAASDSSFPLEAGETVTINASYSPFSASVDFGLVAPDGRFHYLTVENGSIQKTIKVNERGYYTFAIRNNSSDTITVTGFVNY